MIQAPRAKDKEMKPVEEDRAGWLIEAAEGTDLYLPILIALYTGMRRGEILGLRWSDLDLDNARLTVKQSLGQTRAGIHFKKPKNKKSNRTIALSETLIEAFKEHRGRQEKTKALFGPDYPKHDLVLPGNSKIDADTGLLSGVPDGPGKAAIVVTVTIVPGGRSLDIRSLSWGWRR